MPEVWFIRHGESVSNANLRTTHPAKSALTPKGIAESEAVAATFEKKPSLIVLSPYLRARQTAEPTIRRFAPVPQEEWPVYEFTYLDPIRYLNTTGKERGPFSEAYWGRNDPSYKDGGVAESFAELMERVGETRSRLQRHSADFIAVFSHGLFLRALLWTLLTGNREATPEAMKQFYNFMWGLRMLNGAILKSEFRESGEVYFSSFKVSHLAPENPSAGNDMWQQ
jgi:2,3-bisphosphoglycerate-dependent phosphoglycerate mutase